MRVGAGEELEAAVMTRKAAIASIIGTWCQRDGEFCVDAAEYEESYLELMACLEALGVSREEIEARK